MRSHAMMSLVLGAVAIGGIVALRPDPGVEFEAKLSRLEPEEALKELRQAEGKMPFHGNLELLYGRLSLADGDLEAARRSFLRLRSQAALSEEVLETLAGIAVTAGDLPMAAVHLRRAYEVAPSPERRARLSGWYRSLRMPIAERQLLESVDPSELAAWEVERLGLLLVNADRIGDYEQLLSVLAEGDTDGHLAFKRRFIEFLIEGGRAGEAVVAATRWAERQQDGALEMAVRALIGRGAIDAAILVAREGFRVAPEDGHVVLPVFAGSGHGGVARLLQAEWLAGRAQLTDAEWATLALLAETTGDMRGLHAALATQGTTAGPGARAGAFMQFVRYRGAAALVPYRQLLSEDVFTAAPLVGAAWAAWRGDQPASFRHLVVAAKEPLGEWDQLIWMSLFDGLRGSTFHQVLLAGGVDNPDLRRRLRDSVIPPRPADFTALESEARPG
jgi:hypothetical protein